MCAIFALRRINLKFVVCSRVLRVLTSVFSNYSPLKVFLVEKNRDEWHFVAKINSRTYRCLILYPSMSSVTNWPVFFLK